MGTPTYAGALSRRYTAPQGCSISLEVALATTYDCRRCSGITNAQPVAPRHWPTNRAAASPVPGPAIAGKCQEGRRDGAPFPTELPHLFAGEEAVLLLLAGLNTLIGDVVSSRPTVHDVPRTITKHDHRVPAGTSEDGVRP